VEFDEDSSPNDVGEKKNVCNSFIGEDDSVTASPQNMFKQYRHYMPAEQIARDSDLQDEDKKILAKIENALKQLNLERVQMYEQYKKKVCVFSEE
jgi:kinesin family member 16B